MKILSVGAESLHVDRQTDMTKLEVAFLNFANSPNERSSNSDVQLGDLHNSKKWQWFL